MKRRTAAVTAALVALMALVAATGALAGGPGGHGKELFRYVGQVKATSGSSVTVTVQGGNRAALRSLLGQSQEQAFTTDGTTVFLSWKAGIPTRIAIGNLAVGDYVAVNVRAAHDATLGTIVATPAALVGDQGPTIVKPNQPLYLFRGTFTSTSGGAVTIDVSGGNHRALKLMIGQAARQTFTTDGGTVFLQWSQRVPTVIDATKLTPGDRVVVRVRAPKDATLTAVEATAATRVAEHEPKGQEAAQSAQS